MQWRLLRIPPHQGVGTWRIPERHNGLSIRGRNFFPPPSILQSVRGHSAILLPAIINGVQEIHPVICFLFKFSND